MPVIVIRSCMICCIISVLCSLYFEISISTMTKNYSLVTQKIIRRLKTYVYKCLCVNRNVCSLSKTTCNYKYFCWSIRCFAQFFPVVKVGIYQADSISTHVCNKATSKYCFVFLYFILNKKLEEPFAVYAINHAQVEVHFFLQIRQIRHQA